MHFDQGFLDWLNNNINEFFNDFSIQDDKHYQVESGILSLGGTEYVPGTDLPRTFTQSREVQSAQTSDEIGKV